MAERRPGAPASHGACIVTPGTEPRRGTQGWDGHHCTTPSGWMAQPCPPSALAGPWGGGPCAYSLCQHSALSPARLPATPSHVWGESLPSWVHSTPQSALPRPRPTESSRHCLDLSTSNKNPFLLALPPVWFHVRLPCFSHRLRRPPTLPQIWDQEERLPQTSRLIACRPRPSPLLSQLNLQKR